jgi:hypothetical protein
MSKAIAFKVIPLADIPGRPTIVRLATDHHGSQWDEALRELKKSGHANGLRISAVDKKERGKLKSTLQTIAKNRGLSVEVLDDRMSSDFFAWIGEREGRFVGPSSGTH